MGLGSCRGTAWEGDDRKSDGDGPPCGLARPLASTWGLFPDLVECLAGQGGFYRADTRTQLDTALQQALSDIGAATP